MFIYEKIYSKQSLSKNFKTLSTSMAEKGKNIIISSWESKIIKRNEIRKLNNIKSLEVSYHGNKIIFLHMGV